MNKSIVCGLTAALALGLGACSNEMVEPVLNEGNVTFTIEVPAGMATRAYSDGLTATKLHYYVYDEDKTTDNNIAALNGEADFSSLKTTVSLNLVTGKKYSIVFWADKPGNSVYTYSVTDKAISVNYEGATAQDEDRDAFFAYEAFQVTGPISKTITLKRPFAQINVGTTDMAAAEAAGLTVAKTSMVVKGVYNKFDLSTGKVTGDPVNVTFAQAAIPGEGETFPYKKPASDTKTYTYLAMNYVLVSEKTTVDVTLSDDNANSSDMTFAAVPVQRNYRTNIFGALLTNPAVYNVVIDNTYNGEFNNGFSVWDGTTKSEVTPHQETIDGQVVDVYDINDAAGLAWITSESISAAHYVKLNTDIDLDNKKWTSSSKSNMHFDGQNHVIRNMNSTGGLFSSISNSTVENVVLEGGTVSNESEYANVGALASTVSGTSKISNCKNIGVSVYGYKSSGGIAGRINATTVIEGCYNSGDITGAQKNGGIIGFIAGYSSFTTNIRNCTNDGNVAGSTAGTGGILGYAGMPGTIEGCVNNGNVAKGSMDNRYSGGIVGYCAAQNLNINGCKNSGEVNGVSAGGVFGSVGSTQLVNISGCENAGAISAQDTAGGIAANCGDGEIANCVNKGSVTALNVAGGVVGGKINGTITGNQHIGSVSLIDAPIKGRILGVCRSGAGNELKLNNTDGATGDGLPTVGANSTYSTAATLHLTGGNLYGTPVNKSASTCYIIVDEGASWDAFPGETGKWAAATNSDWRK